MRAVSIAVAASCWIATACPVQAAPAQSTPFAARHDTNSTFQQLAKRYNAGIAVGVIRNHRLVWTGYYGEQSSGVPVTEKTMFNVASLAKPVTAEAILRLASEGRIVLDEPMSRYWVDPDVFADPRHKLLTPEIALSHRTGFRNWRYMEKDKKLSFHADPGTKMGYSGEGYDYVARFAEKKLGVSFDQLVQTRVFDPIGMQSASISYRPGLEARLNQPIDSKGARQKPELQKPGEWTSADDLFVTIPDYAAFMISVSKSERLTPEIAAERRKIRASTTEGCTTTAEAPCPDPAGHSLGWEILTFSGRQIFWHTGGDWSESTVAYFYPDTGDGLVAFINAAENNRPTMLDIFDAVDDPSPIRAGLRAYEQERAAKKK